MLAIISNRNIWKKQSLHREAINMIFLKTIISLLLLIVIIDPETGWSMSEGRKFKDAEPSNANIKITRVIAVAILILIWFAIPMKL